MICWLETVNTYVTALPQTYKVKVVDESIGNPLPANVAVTPPPGLLDAGVIEPTFKLMVSVARELSSAYPVVARWTIGF